MENKMNDDVVSNLGGGSSKNQSNNVDSNTEQMQVIAEMRTKNQGKPQYIISQDAPLLNLFRIAMGIVAVPKHVASLW